MTKRRVDRTAAELDEEVAFHLTARTDQLIAAGWDPAAAREEARRRFGPFDDTMRSLHTEVRRREERLSMLALLQGIRQDVRYGARQLARFPGIAAGAIGILAIGIGATTAIFTLAKHTLLDPLPYAAQDRLVYLTEEFKGSRALVSYPNFADWREQARTFDAMGAVTPQWSAPVFGADEPVVAPIQGVSRGLFEMLGVRPLIGRTIAPEENRDGAAMVAVVSEPFWRAHLGATTNLRGVTLQLFGNPVPVVGVMPKDFRALATADVWFPLENGPVRLRAAGNYLVIGRLTPGVTIDGARAEMNGIAARLKARYGDDELSATVPMIMLRDEVIGTARRPLYALLIAAAFVLVVTCVNITMVLLARGVAREREMAVRVALGASRWRLVRQTVVETSTLAFLGAAGGVFLAWGAIVATRNYGRGQLPRLTDLALSPASAAFAAFVALLTVVVFSAVPALSSRRFAVNAGRGLASGGSRPSRSWSVLIAVQSAATVVVLSGATLIARSVLNVIGAKVGYEATGVAVARVSLPPGVYRTTGAVSAIYGRIAADVAAIPGVQAVGVVNSLPTQSQSYGAPIVLPPVATPDAPSSWAVSWAGLRVVTPGYFAALGIPLERGRMFSSVDISDGPSVALVNHSMAERLWPGQNPIGKRLRSLIDKHTDGAIVIGVVGDARDWRKDPGQQPELYMSLDQRPDLVPGSLTVVARTTRVPSAVATDMRTRIRRIDARIPLALSTLADDVRSTDANRRFIAGILGAFAGVVIVLTIIGVFGTVSYSVTRRARELGIRLALGATPGWVWADVERRVLGVVSVGVIVGGIIAISSTRALGSLLYQVSPRDGASLAVSLAAVIAAAFLAALWPAVRASRTDAGAALRAE